MPTPPLDPQVITDIDGYLKPNVPAIIDRYNMFRGWKDTIDEYEGGYDNFTKGYLKFGFNLGSKNEVVYREWAPNAKEAFLIGDFSASTIMVTECVVYLFLLKTNGIGTPIQ